MKSARLKLKRTKIKNSMVRDKYGNLKKNAWNQWMKEEIDTIDKQIEELNEEYIKTHIFKNLED